MKQDPVTSRKCSKCNVMKLASDFYVDQSKKSGFKSSCKSCQPKKVTNYPPKNLEKYKESRAEYYAKNSEKIKARIAANRIKNLDKDREKSARKYAEKLQRTIPLNQIQKSAIKNIYSFADWVSKKTGERHHVDHIVPLKGKNMSGLHVPWNLRVISQKENLMKKNKVDDSISMPTCMNGRNRQC